MVEVEVRISRVGLLALERGQFQSLLGDEHLVRLELDPPHAQLLYRHFDDDLEPAEISAREMVESYELVPLEVQSRVVGQAA